MININDYPTEAHRLFDLLSYTYSVKMFEWHLGDPRRSNVIPLNSPIATYSFGSTGSNETGEFCGELKNNDISCNMRRTRGEDIIVTCGQFGEKYL